MCLECGKQFAYDWNRMRIGKAIENSPDTGVLNPEMPGAAKTKIKYALFGSAIPLAVLLGSALFTNRRGATRPKADGAGPRPEVNVVSFVNSPSHGPTRSSGPPMSWSPWDAETRARSIPESVTRTGNYPTRPAWASMLCARSATTSRTGCDNS